MVLNYIYALYSDGIKKKKRIDISPQAEKKELKDFFFKRIWILEELHWESGRQDICRH